LVELFGLNYLKDSDKDSDKDEPRVLAGVGKLSYISIGVDHQI
jgi:hypothetical protein